MIPLYYFNFKKKKKVFLGDGGSLFMGTLVMIYLLYILGPEYHMNPKFPINKTLFSILVLLYPLVDLLRVFVIRIKSGKSPFVADQRHIHHLISNRFSHIKTLILIESIYLVILYLFYL